MGSPLQQALRSFCLNGGWKYAIFWKIKHRTRMMFTWGDAYYDGNQVEKKWFNPAAGNSIEGPYSHDPLGLAVAKMSYQVYSLGEGVVGKVAVSGKYSWIFSDELDSSSSEYADAWQIQFSAGIKTIAVVAVIPYGIVQLGSLHKISEDAKLVDHIRNVFSGLQDFLPDCIPSSIQSYAENSCQSDTCTKIQDSFFHDSIGKIKGSLHEDGVNSRSQLLSSLGESVNRSHAFPQIGNFSNKTLKSNMQERAGPSMPGNEISLPLSSVSILSRPPQQAGMETLKNMEFGGETSDSRDLGKVQEIMSTSAAKNVQIENLNISNSTLLDGSSKMITSDLPLQTQHFENLQLPIKSNHADIHISPFGFSAGYELFEALGPSFRGQKSDSLWEPEKVGPNIPINISEGIGSCSLLTENSNVNLLEAVVARAGLHKGHDTEKERSCHESILTADKTPCKSLDVISSFDRDTSCSFNSVTRSVESLRGFPCTSSSIGSEHLGGRAHMPVKPVRKRARPGESTRPRPRDRQLIQDRIKELRELVPSGSKCSIDSLLERTIKHMMYLQNVTKHAEKLNNCSVSKLLAKETGIRRFSCCEQGSSWAVELGNNQKVCPIIVENINMNGQMLVEMLSKESGQFLEIAETIRSLGLTILKGESETYGDQMRMCFIVEAENNRSMHRMDVLWSLMQLLQPKNV